MKAFGVFIAMLAFGGGIWASPNYTLVQGIDKFDGSLRAWHLLETNGFVVADPSYSQIFQPYLDDSLPAFITTESAWLTYQTLLSQGVKQINVGPIGWHTTNSALELFAGCAELRSPAAEHALGGISSVRPAEYSLPTNSFAAESLRVLATLQQPLPKSVAPALRSEAWGEKELWTQLAGCVEMNYHADPATEPQQGNEPGAEEAKGGVVAPYPEFFTRLAKLSRETAAAMENVGLDETFNTKAAAQRLLDGIFTQEQLREPNTNETVKMAREFEQFNRFFAHYSETHQVEEEARNSAAAAQRLFRDLEVLARRCLNNGTPSEEDTAVLRSLFDSRLTSPRLLRNFAGTCDKLAELALDFRDGKPVTGDDEKWMSGYGMLLQSYCVSPGERDDGLSTITALGTNNNSTLWAGLGRAEALYIILPAKGRLQLYRGAVLSYREFTRTETNAMDDKLWQQQIESGNVPPPPDFTADFRAEKSAVDILDTLESETHDQGEFQENQRAMEALQSRVTDADLPALIAALGKRDHDWDASVSSGIAGAISKLNWKDRQKELLSVIGPNEGVQSSSVLWVLLQHPEWLDTDFLIENFEGKPSHVRRIFTILLGHAPETDRTRAALLRALRDDSAAVRWQGVIAIGRRPWGVAEKIPPLLDMLKDTNELVGGLAAITLGKIGATNAAPILFTNLQERLQAPQPSAGTLGELMAPLHEAYAVNLEVSSNPFDPDGLLMRRLTSITRHFGGDPRLVETFTPVMALVEALGDLDYQPATATILGLLGSPDSAAAATAALKKLAPAELTRRLVSIANDKNAQAPAREQALILLTEAPGANASDLAPVLDDHTVIPLARPMPGREWRVCDRAAMTMALLLGRTLQMSPVMPEPERDQQIEQMRQWLKSAY